MERAEKSGAPARAARKIGKLLKVLVMGGAVLGANCATPSKSGSGGDSSQSGSRDGRRAPEQGGGVQGW
jgi:hypothetical protein